MTRRLETPPPHGTRKRYQWRQGPCRCRACCTANTAYKRWWYHERRTPAYQQLVLPDEWLPMERAS